ncbi:hypothetical protein ABZ805_26570 [Saccharopolyspora sp. NPDC047091]|uniref:hypothetical protein n=1 Tax=Saccharopolyspora sp. NPDC047091 TaxID=3155924 RepID=UPI0034007C91
MNPTCGWPWTRPIPAHGPTLADPERLEFQEIPLTWSPVDAGVQVELGLPTGPVRAAGVDLFSALMLLRVDIEDDGWGWTLLVAAAWKRAWGPTDRYPCDIGAVRFFADDGTPETEPVDALARLASSDLFEYRPRVQWTERMRRETGADHVRVNSGPYWRHIDALREGRKEAEFDPNRPEDFFDGLDKWLKNAPPHQPACIPTERQRREVLPHAEKIYIRGRKPRTPEPVQALAEWGRRDDGGVHLRLTGPFGQLSAEAENVFVALLRIRWDLFIEAWEVLVNAALREAWGSTPLFPCGIAHVRLYPSVLRAPANDQIDALGTPADFGDERDFRAPQQQSWHWRWAGPKGFGNGADVDEGTAPGPLTG